MHKPKGKLLAIGGNVDKGSENELNFDQKRNLNFFSLGILKRLVEESGGKDSHIEIITTASSIPEEVSQNYIDAFDRLSCTNVHVMHIKNRLDCANPEYLERLNKCDCVLFTGGNQLRLSTIIGGTTAFSILSDRYMNEPLLIAGTSAGAMVMSNTMIYQGSSTEALLMGEVKITTGFGFMKNVIIDTHFVKRGRFGRLTQAVACNPSCIGIGLGEDTAVLVTEGDKMEAIGSGLVLLFDGHDIKFTNISDVPEGTPISIENMIIHILALGNLYLLKERKFIPHKDHYELPTYE